jgi:N-methylhydantoinase B
MNKDTERERFLGSIFSSVPVEPGDTFFRPSAGGGGFGDPLERTPEEVLEDIIDDYVSIERAAIDYGVVIIEIDRGLDQFEIDHEATKEKRAWIREHRDAWLQADPAEISAKYRSGELDLLDVIRQHGVILDWGTGELLEETTRQYREQMQRRSADHWKAPEALVGTR